MVVAVVEQLVVVRCLAGDGEHCELLVKCPLNISNS